MLATVAAASLVGCAAPPACAPVAAPTAIRGPSTKWENCLGMPALDKGAPALLSYSGVTADSIRVAERVVTGPHTLLCEPSAVALGPRGEVYVLNRLRPDRSGQSRPTAEGWTMWVTVYDSAASDDAAPIRALGIPPLAQYSLTGIAVDTAGYLYVGSELGKTLDQGSVSVFDPGADGNVAPIRVLSGPRTGLRKPGELAIDRRGSLYVLNGKGDALDDTVRVFGAASEGNAEPCRLIAGAQTGLERPVGLALDLEDRLYVANGGRSSSASTVTVYDSDASGDTSPSRTITAAEIADRMVRPRRVAMGRRDSLYVRSERNLSVFGPAEADADRPSRTFYRAAPDLFALDKHDSLYALFGDEIAVYPPGYTGSEPAVRKIGGPSAGIRGTTDMALDSHGWLYLLTKSSIRVFPPGASGDVGPSRTIAGDRTRLTEAQAIALDRAGRLYVTNGPQPAGAGGIRVYAPGASGDEEPVRVLAGPGTGLSRPIAMTFDSEGYLYVAGERWEDPGFVSVFRPGAGGNEAPVRTLVGPTTLLRRPMALAMGPGDTLYALNLFGYAGSHRCVTGSTNATVTAYAPGALGDTEPIRHIVLVANAKSFAPGHTYGWYLPRGIGVDAGSGVQVWHTVGAVRYEAGANGFVPPSRNFFDSTEDGTETRGAALSRDGRIYRTAAPIIMPMFC